MKRKIIWEKWINPLSDTKELMDSEDYFDMEKEDLDTEIMESNPRMTPVVLTQFGPLPVKPYNHPAKHFRFWVAHTNFYITEEVKKTIVTCPGVEIFDVFSPYRFRIAIGMCFDEKTVMENINYLLITSDEIKRNPAIVNINEMTNKQLLDIKKEIEESKHNYWSILILPNGNIEHNHTSNLREHQVNRANHEKIKEKAGGVILNSEGQNS